mmetsp:Transcript_65559/g.142962  ORF Transcript_65559/g.142962 Transcript_65559/m.142962 type:complete len:861 (-) Transcript_65559:216-2798(-)
MNRLESPVSGRHVLLNTSSAPSVQSDHKPPGIVAATSSLLYEQAGVKLSNSITLNDDRLKELDKATYRDERWTNARQHLFGDGLSAPTEKDRELVAQILREGAKAFGIWHVSSVSLLGLARQILSDEEGPSPAFTAWLESTKDRDRPSTSTRQGELDQRQIVSQVSMSDAELRRELRNAKWSGFQQAILDGYVSFATNEIFAAKVFLCVFVFICSNAYALKVVLHSYPGIIDYFDWPIYVARAGGMATAILTGFLFLSMARSASKEVYALFPFGLVSAIFTAHRDLHIFAGEMMLWLGIMHAVAHLIGTAPGVQSTNHKELNKLLGCANPDTTPGYLGVRFSYFQWPACPLEKNYSLMDVVFLSTPGLTGLLLVVIILVLAYTGSRKNRSVKFDRFWNLHNLALVAWPVILFIHGSNGWVGVGFPLVVFTSSVPILLHLIDRVLRRIRYLIQKDSLKIVEAVIRPGKGGAAMGSLTYLRISRPKYLWRFWCGEYAMINMPEYSRMQWHPFTICSGSKERTVDFLIASVGDWTQELATRCTKALHEGSPLPRLALDGPYMAPTQSAMNQKVLVAVGAGVGITPFLSLMSTIVALYEESRSNALPLKEAHFYWMTRNADELLFGRKLFEKVVTNHRVRERVFLHLHLTHPTPEKNAPAFLFREAIRRQSQVDRKAFVELMGDKPTARILVGPQVPWCWANQAKDDVCWFSHLLPGLDIAEETVLLEDYADNWALGLLKSTSRLQLPQATTVGNENADREEGSQDGSPSTHATGVTGASRVTERPKESDWMLPVAFSRPDFATEVRAIGLARPGDNVNVYVCGNDSVVKALATVCTMCNAHAEKAEKNGAPRQRYWLHHERFG